ncbi:condensation domain-containing protein [Pseudonocardia endophytica]|uniref:Condensation domain-containing protein n=1 Tax=Pseudonocardia endophytica TaxID=401976 RepID=A0A4R1HXK6_PSEEN|nr:condensation domain-containing protein [Pseudonocardia endophytica]TCK22282.1 condensation domain-containing protein [Pseudonocardia endophytica]
MSVEAALSHGQLYSWREIETYPPSCMKEANVPATLDLRGIPTDRVEHALSRLVAWHEILRTTYHTESGAPVQRIHDDVEIPVERIDRRIGPAEVGELTEDFLAVAIPMTGGLLWRALLVSTDGEPMLLVFSFSHLISDVWTSLEVVRQFGRLVEDPDAPDPGTPSQREVGAAQHDPAFARRQEAAERYWAEHWAGVDGLPGLLRLPTLPYDTTKERIQATLRSGLLGSLAAEAAQRHRTTVPAALLAMLTAALARHTGAHRIPVGVMSSNRFPPSYRQALGTFNQLMPVVVEVDGAGSLGDHLTAVHWTVTKAYRHSCYDIDRVARQAAERGAQGDHDCWFNHQFPFWFNYVQLDDEPPAGHDEPAEVTWTPAPRACGQPIDVRVNLLRGTTEIRLRTDPDVVDADGLAGILRTVAAGTARAATGLPSRVDDLWEAVDDVPDALFPSPVSVV